MRVEGEASVNITGSEISNNLGGGIYCEYGGEAGSVEIDDCVITGNQSEFGAGVYVSQGSVSIRDSEISSNWAEEFAGGIHCAGTSVVIDNCSIVDNYCGRNASSGVLLSQCEATIDGCQISRNWADQGFGGWSIYSYESKLLVNNCVIGNNITINSSYCSAIIIRGDGSEFGISNSLIITSPFSNYGIGLSSEVTEGPITVDNCTIIAGFSGSNDACIDSYASQLTVNNSILWGTQSPVNPNQGQVTINYSDVQGGWDGDGVGNIDVDPEFAEDGLDEFGEQIPYAVKDYHLKSTAGRYDGATEIWVQDYIDSPCIDAGDPGYGVGGEPLGSGGLINMGAYGGTVEASLTDICNGPVAGDINNDCTVDFVDFAMLAGNWLVSTVEE